MTNPCSNLSRWARHAASWLGVLLVLASAAPALAAQGEILPRYKGSVAGFNFGFYEYLPQGYDTNSNSYPLVIFLHGLGEFGDGSTSVQNGLPKLMKAGMPTGVIQGGRHFPFILVAPQRPVSGWWNNGDITAVIDKAKQLYRVDANRVYLTGLSSGGHGVWTYIATYPERIAAAVPISGTGNNSTTTGTPIRPSGTNWWDLDNCPGKNVPTWAFHNTGDPTVGQSGSIDPVNRLNNTNAGIDGCVPVANPAAKLTLYPVSGHDAWTKTYNGSAGYDIYTWMLSYSKAPAPTTYALTVNGGSGDGAYTQGSVVAIQADAAPAGMVFAGWTGNTSALATASAAQTTVTMPASAVTVTATYVAITYALTVNNGSGDGNYAAGATISIQADAAPAGMQFLSWSGSTSALANASAAQTTVTMPASPVTVTAQYTPIAPPEPDRLYGINAGGPAYTASNGDVFATDAYFSGGYTATTTGDLTNTTDDALCLKYRYGTADFSYSFPVANGQYDVVLWLNETGYAAGGRLVDIYVENALAFNDLDVFVAAGGRMKLYRVTTTATVTDGKVDLRFGKVVGNPMVCAIEVFAAN